MNVYHNHGKGKLLPGDGTLHPASLLIITDDIADVPPGMKVYRNTDEQAAMVYDYDGNGVPKAYSLDAYLRARDTYTVYVQLS